jgi:sugar/nucleoside kinase (ribokinase family)
VPQLCGACCFSPALVAAVKIYKAAVRERVEILDRVGGGDSFMSGVAAGFLNGKGPQEVTTTKLNSLLCLAS